MEGESEDEVEILLRGGESMGLIVGLSWDMGEEGQEEDWKNEGDVKLDGEVGKDIHECMRGALKRERGVQHHYIRLFCSKIDMIILIYYININVDVLYHIL